MGCAPTLNMGSPHFSRAAAVSCILGEGPMESAPCWQPDIPGNCVTSQGQRSVPRSRPLQQPSSIPPGFLRETLPRLSASSSCVRVLLPAFLSAGEGGALRMGTKGLFPQAEAASSAWGIPTTRAASTGLGEIPMETRRDCAG